VSEEALRNRINTVIEARLVRIDKKGRRAYFSYDELLLTKTNMKDVLRDFILIKKAEAK